MTINKTHQSNDLITLFNDLFAPSFQTRLVSGSGEPLYLPATNRRDCHQVVFAHGFFRSALHEIAHWCIAGKVRRQLADYGYWYKPDGRNLEEQLRFQQAELKPQALEWWFCLCAGHSFEVSCDNLAASDPDAIDVAGFAEQVRQQLINYRSSRLPPRAEAFAIVLQSFYGQSCPRLAEVA
ncbi:elongation factor P hydroxylase [Aliidiomarina minuta]|uniref:Elongation factor P hydroxylase n=1 Tax=Aliidiomarina minuta TaxID=880057 RepID=A0A432W5L4_9GAMM|nr:elongation factor P hydroxylase [Aliidiomarina minuta]RUO25360.1 elongation factor P hydroxylase [Aliidiomarina minuta]